MNDVVIETKDNIILLGVVLDSKLNFSEHIISICKKASQRIGVLMRLRNLIPMKSKLILFKSAILPFLTYCHLVWHFCKASVTRKLERLQERGLRAVFKDNNSSYEQLLEKADLPTLLNSRLQDLCILMYKVNRVYINRVYWKGVHRFIDSIEGVLPCDRFSNIKLLDVEYHLSLTV